MKFNTFQKIVLVIYACLFVYFAILHVPFRNDYSGEVSFDTLFSDSYKLDIGRLILTIVILSIPAYIIIFLLRNINYSSKPSSRKTAKLIFFISAGLVLLVALILIASLRGFHKRNGPVPVVNTSILDTTGRTDTASILQKKLETCTVEHALKSFNSCMKFYYPDWKIYGNPVVKEQTDCTFRIQFTTIDPHIKLEKEIIIAEISYSYEYTRYRFKTIRGTLY